MCIDTQHGGGWASHWGHSASVLTNASLGYWGGLIIVCVPRGSKLSLSDIPYVQTREPQWWDFVAPKPVIDQRELEPVLRR
jgi:hypothetical protein